GRRARQHGWWGRHRNNYGWPPGDHVAHEGNVVDGGHLPVSRARADVHVDVGEPGSLRPRRAGASADTGCAFAAADRDSADGPAGAGASTTPTEQSPTVIQHPLTSCSRTAPGSPELRLSRLSRHTRKSSSQRI